MDSAKQRLAAAVNDYFHRSRMMPRRITVSYELAKQLDAEKQAMDDQFGVMETKPLLLLVDGATMMFQGIPIVADMESKYVCDIDSGTNHPDGESVGDLE